MGALAARFRRLIGPLHILTLSGNWKSAVLQPLAPADVNSQICRPKACAPAPRGSKSTPPSVDNYPQKR
jgi:hypothetical protein